MFRILSARLRQGHRTMAVPDEYDDSESHPLRVAAYLVHPIGVALEWAIFRPFHYLVSLPGADVVFGFTR